MKTASIVINAIILASTLACVATCFRQDGRWKLKKGWPAFRFFTVLSNVFCAATALIMLLGQLSGKVSHPVVLLKYLGTSSVTVTLMTVLLFLGPTQGYRELFVGTNLYMHLLGPLLAIASFCFTEKDGLSLPEAMLGLLPVLLYGIVYLYKVILAPEGRRWEDFYGFNRGGKWPVSFAGMLVGTALVCLLLWKLG